MLTVEEFNSLEVGDLIETGPIFKALSDDPVILHTAKIEEDGGDRSRVEFMVTYMGVTLGRWSCNRKGEELEWETV
jgi:hypothetical protein